jgi:hypothetical protein
MMVAGRRKPPARRHEHIRPKIHAVADSTKQIKKHWLVVEIYSIWLFNIAMENHHF